MAARPVSWLFPAMSTDPDLPLAADFPPATRDDWRKLVAALLKGRSAEDLASKTYDRLVIAPLYEGVSDARPIAGRTAPNPWQVVQRVDHPDPATANAQALQDLENGATSLSLVFAGSVGAHGYGLPPSPDGIARALDGIHLDGGISLELDLGSQAKDAPDILASLIDNKAVSPAATQIRFGF